MKAYAIVWNRVGRLDLGIKKTKEPRLTVSARHDSEKFKVNGLWVDNFDIYQTKKECKALMKFHNNPKGFSIVSIEIKFKIPKGLLL